MSATLVERTPSTTSQNKVEREVYSPRLEKLTSSWSSKLKELHSSLTEPRWYALGEQWLLIRRTPRKEGSHHDGIDFFVLDEQIEPSIHYVKGCSEYSFVSFGPNDEVVEVVEVTIPTMKNTTPGGYHLHHSRQVIFTGEEGEQNLARLLGRFFRENR